MPTTLFYYDCKHGRTGRRRVQDFIFIFCHLKEICQMNYDVIQYRVPTIELFWNFTVIISPHGRVGVEHNPITDFNIYNRSKRPIDRKRQTPMILQCFFFFSLFVSIQILQCRRTPTVIFIVFCRKKKRNFILTRATCCYARFGSTSINNVTRLYTCSTSRLFKFNCNTFDGSRRVWINNKMKKNARYLHEICDCAFKQSLWW